MSIHLHNSILAALQAIQHGCDIVVLAWTHHLVNMKQHGSPGVGAECPEHFILIPLLQKL